MGSITDMFFRLMYLLGSYGFFLGFLRYTFRFSGYTLGLGMLFGLLDILVYFWVFGILVYVWVHSWVGYTSRSYEYSSSFFLWVLCSVRLALFLEGFHD